MKVLHTLKPVDSKIKTTNQVFLYEEAKAE